MPERIIQVPGCVDAWQLGYVCRLRLQTRGLKVLTVAECMPDLIVQSQGEDVSRDEGFCYLVVWGEGVRTLARGIVTAAKG